jgi:hypothetical protein
MEPEKAVPAKTLSIAEVVAKALALNKKGLEKSKNIQINSELQTETSSSQEESKDLETKAAELFVMQEKTFSEPADFTLLSSSDSEKINSSSHKLATIQDADDLFAQTPGSKMMFLKGNLYKSNINFNDQEIEYYNFIGKAYNSKVLNRATIEGQAPGSSQFTYVVDGQP